MIYSAFRQCCKLSVPVLIFWWKPSPPRHCQVLSSGWQSHCFPGQKWEFLQVMLWSKMAQISEYGCPNNFLFQFNQKCLMFDGRSRTVHVFYQIELEEGTLCPLVIHVSNCPMFPSVQAMFIISVICTKCQIWYLKLSEFVLPECGAVYEHFEFIST